jgi:flagellar hook assembly protein FlgD
VPIYDLKIHAPTYTLVAGTHGRSLHSIDLNDVTGVSDDEVVTSVLRLASHPNPFGERTRVAYSLTRPSRVTLAVYDVAGHLVRTLESGTRGAGEHEVHWDGTNAHGRAVANGTYFLRLEAGEDVAAHKVSLVR